MDGGAAKLSELRNSGGKDTDDTEISEVPRSLSSRPSHTPLPDDSFNASKFVDKQQKRTSPADEQSRLNKRRKGDSDAKDGDGLDARFSDRERSVDPRLMDKSHPTEHEKNGSDEQNLNRPTDKLLDRSKDKGSERYDRDHRERLERPDKSRGEDMVAEMSRDRSMERYGRERSIERMQEKGAERNFDRAVDKPKDDRSKPRYSETSIEKSHPDDRFHGQNLPPPPPLPPNIVPQSVSVSRRDEDADRRVGSTRHIQRLSPRHEEKERRRSEENLLITQDDAKRRREDDFRERKRDERDGMSMKVEERERDKGNILKDDMDATAASKRRKIKRDHLSSAETGGENSQGVPPLSPLPLGMSQTYDGRERGDKKGPMVQRTTYTEEQVPRMHGKEASSKITRRDSDQIYERDWEDEKRQRAEAKRRHRPRP
eukprot:TRINITY_DN5020_c0_g1_i1.p1 TRINITY_DN5020_c0_g1~~TRINITY_DN5020_c0_g1_i1.p1  ORF type:complete len:485 (+),score=114.72 TRINITY_DN5020_c0_g1_i1:171-1457(+)